MNITRTALVAASLSLAPLAAQDQNIGLQMDGGVLAVIYGQACGPVSCTPFPGGVIAAGEPRTLYHGSAPQRVYAIAIGLPGPCVQVPGFNNVLMLDAPIVIDWGLTSAPPFAPTGCNQGVAGTTFSFPVGMPAGLTFRVQSMGVGDSGLFAFGPAIEAVTG